MSWPSRFLVLTLALLLGACGGEGDSNPAQLETATESERRPVILATTTSTQDSGLLDELIPAFEEETGYRVKTIAVGSGQALELAGRGEADVVLAHSPDAEEELMAKGAARERRIVMHNDFVIVGPREDPAGIEGAQASDAFRRIAERAAPFVSRGDDSGTHVFELKVWKLAGVEPAGAWYQKTGQGMGPTLQVASQKQAYALADRGTYLATEQGESLPILVEREPPLVNLYHVIDMTSEAGPRVNVQGGRAFADWIVSPATQKVIGGFGKAKFGQPLFVPDAGRSEAEARREA